MWALLLVGSLAIGDHEPSRLAAQEVMTRTRPDPIQSIRVGMTPNEVQQVIDEPFIRLFSNNFLDRESGFHYHYYPMSNIEVMYSKSFNVLHCWRPK